MWIPESSITSIAAYDSVERMMAVSPAWVDEEIDNSPTVVKLLAVAEQHKERMEKIREVIFNPEMDPQYQKSDQMLKKVEAQLAAERKRLRPGIVRQSSAEFDSRSVQPRNCPALRAAKTVCK